ncbi:hypothetical protein [Helicobacter suis]|uniref:hypothetical protein n=1 Tax=Helicobacter suis TaxID=104628 RepID=UPI0013D12A87|nr:hypothetical protein [Helicobacter suis]
MPVTDFTNEPIINDRETKADFFEKIKQRGNFVGVLYELDYEKAKIILNDSEKNTVKGIPLGCFLVALCNNELRENALEGILLRVVGVAEIPQKQENTETLTDACLFKREIDRYTQYYLQNSVNLMIKTGITHLRSICAQMTSCLEELHFLG